MRSLAATALTLAFFLMAAITYLAVKGDPLGGEPRLTVTIPAPDPAKPHPASVAPPAAVPPETTGSTAPISGNDAGSAGTSAALSGTGKTDQAAPAPSLVPSAGADFAGVGITLPQD